MLEKRYLIPLLLLTTLILVGSCSMLMRNASAQGFTLTIQSQQDNGATQNKGTVLIGGTSSPLPKTMAFAGSFNIEYTAAAGYVFVRWTTAGGVSVSGAYNSATTVTVTADGTLTAIYKSSVGGVVTPVSTLMVLSPYLALIGLVAATTIAAVKTKRKA